MAFANAMNLLTSHGFSCDVTLEELVNWFDVQTAYPDLSLDQVLRKPLLIVHEIAELAEVKRMGLPIACDTILKNRSRVYEAHLRAFEVELALAKRVHDLAHIRERLREVENWTTDPLLPRRLRPRCRNLHAQAEEALKECHHLHSKDLRIRRAKREDWKPVLLIQQSDSVFPYLGRPSRPSKVRVRDRWLLRLAEPGVYTLVAVSGDEVVGYVRLKRGEGLGSHVGEISAVAVRPDFQRKGVGGRLMNEMFRVADDLGLRRLRLTVHSDNAVAIHLYESLGFEVEGREREAVRRGRKFIDLLIMGRLEPRP